MGSRRGLSAGAIILVVVTAFAGCGSGSKPAATPRSTVSGPTTTVDPYILAVDNALSGGGASAVFNNSCNGSQSALIPCRNWALQHAQWSRGALAKMQALHPPAQYAAATQQVIAVLTQGVAADDALAAACASAPAGATRHSDSTLDSAISQAGLTSETSYFEAVQRIDPAFEG